jgi:crotonobetainyl-CoA:carnitine CoA-transferase CaiB-like acyl-CoA transferase
MPVLSGVRVLDLTDESGWLAGRILAELGADVVKAEAPGGDPARRRGPFLGGREDPERCLRWLALNASKRGIVLDLESDAGRDDFRSLVARADVLLETLPPGWLAARGLDSASLRALHPRLVHCSITPFGSEGPWSHFRASDLVVVAMGGNAALTGDADRAPLRCTLPSSSFHGAPEAALGVVMALHAREQTGRGERVDVSLQECQLGTLMGGPGQLVLRGRAPRRSGPRTGRTREIWAAKDGCVSFGLRGGPARVPGLVALVGLMAESGMAPEWLRALDWSRFDPAALSEEEVARLETVFGEFFRSRTLRDLFGEALRRRILLAPCNDAAAVLAQEQLRARELFAAVEHPELGATLELPARFARTSPRAIGVRRRAPRVGEHSAEVARDWAGQGAPAGAIPPAAGEQAARGLFAGLRILEFGAGAAGPLVTRPFVEQGATVVRVESARRPDFLRLIRSADARASGLDASPMFVLLNPGKQSVRLDLARPEGAALARRLVAWADVVTENFAPGVMARLGLDWESARRIRPDLVWLSACLFGQTGPQRQYPGFGGQGSAIAGFNALTGWPDREALGPYGTITDSLSPRFGALLVAAALLERRRSGRGQHIDLSQIETGVYCLSEMVARASANRESPTRLGNHDPNAAPHAIYPCAGEDRWIAIAVLEDGEWRALAHAMGDPVWAADPRFATLAGRKAAEDELDGRIGDWTRGFEPYALMQRLQDAGVRAGVVQDFADLLRDPQLASRGHFRRLRHASLGELDFEHTGLRLAAHPPRLEAPGPLLGEHDADVLGGILGLSPAEIERLVADEVVI